MISTIVLLITLYTILCSLVMRLDQQPAKLCFSCSGLPIPVTGSFSIDISSAEIRAIALISPVVFQYLRSSNALAE